LKLDSALLRDSGLLNSYHLSLHLGQFRRRLFVSADEESCWPEDHDSSRRGDAVFCALVEMACASRASCWHVYDWYATGETYAGAISAEEEAQPASAAPSTTIPKFRIF
jgi:hypothetical protein